MTERIESVIPFTYLLTFLMAYYGPNAEILGNIKLTIWQYQSVADIEDYIKNLLKLLVIDFSSFATNGILLWITCKINVFKVLQKVQAQFWLIMTIQEAFLFFEVKFNYTFQFLDHSNHSLDSFNYRIMVNFKLDMVKT